MDFGLGGLGGLAEGWVLPVSGAEVGSGFGWFWFLSGPFCETRPLTAGGCGQVFGHLRPEAFVEQLRELLIFQGFD